MAATVKKAPAPAAKTARKRPDFSGVPGKIVDIGGREMSWGPSARRSPYDPLLKSLMAAGPGKALEFEGVRAWASVAARARKLGIRVESCAQDGRLYVRLAEKQGDPDEARAQRHDAVLRSVRAMPGTFMQAAAAVRRGGVEIDAQQCNAILLQLSKQGKVELRADGKWYATA